MERNQAIDSLRAICAFFIVWLHYAKPWFAKNIIEYEILHYLRAIVSIGVPIFFLITGYYLEQLIKSNKLSKHIKKIFTITIYASLLYLIPHLIWHYYLYGNDFLSHTFNKDSIINFFTYNKIPFGGYHLWYLFSLLYSLVIIWGVNTWWNMKAFINIILLLFLTYIILLRLIPIPELPPTIDFSLPLLAIGVILSKINFRNIGSIHFIPAISILLISSLFLMWYECHNYKMFFIDGYYSTLLISVLFIIIAIRYPNLFYTNFLANIGRNHSTGIYIYHVLVGTAIWAISESIYYNALLAPFVIIISSLLISVLIQRIIKLKSNKTINT